MHWVLPVVSNVVHDASSHIGADVCVMLLQGLGAALAHAFAAHGARLILSARRRGKLQVLLHILQVLSIFSAVAVVYGGNVRLHADV